MSRKPPVLEIVPEKCLHRNDAGSLKLTISFYVGGLFIFILSWFLLAHFLLCYHYLDNHQFDKLYKIM